MGDRTPFDNEILKYVDTHLLLKYIDFLSAQDKSATLLEYKKESLFRTSLFDEQENFLKEHKDLDQGESEKISERRTKSSKYEDELKTSIKGFLNLVENFRKANKIDTSSTMHKKIVLFINLD